MKTKARVRFHNRIPTLTVDGYSITVSQLTASAESNFKLAKSRKGHLLRGLSLAPHRMAGVGNVCPDASPTCIAGCIAGSGLSAVFPRINAARKARTILFYQERQWFLDQLYSEASAFVSKAKASGLMPAMRLNVFSDIKWERMLPDLFNLPIQFYDYTKSSRRFGNVPNNYHLTFSRSERNERTALKLLAAGHNVAVVFDRPTKTQQNDLPSTWKGFPVTDGDLYDHRFLDPQGGYVVGLRAKGPTNASLDVLRKSGFSVQG